MIVVIVGGLITGLVLLKNTLNKSCSSGEVYDNKLGCIKDCSPLPNMRYDSQKKDCVPNCLDGQIFCGTTCIYNNQKCLDNDIICDNNDNVLLCGKTCYDNTKQKCIADVVYDNNKVCNSSSDTPVLCKDNEQCSQDNTKCISCGTTLCKGDICCNSGEYCDKDGVCKSCTTDQTSCGSTCCDSGYKCDGKGKCVKCDHDLCGSNCCDDDVIGCINKTDCCDPKKIYKINDTLDGCCNEELTTADKKCCSINGQKLINGKCMIKCGDGDNEIYCDPDTQLCGETIGDKNKFYCATNGCAWGPLTYNPPDFPDPTNISNSIPVFYGNNKLYISQQGFPLSRSVYDAQTSKIDCQNNDCIERLVENGLQNVKFDPTTDPTKKTCNGDFDPSKVLPKSILSCPLKNDQQCCKDSSGNFTGQVCQNGQSCINNNGVYFCTSCADTDCNQHGKCSMTVEDQCECIDGYDPDPSINCSKCLSGRQSKIVNRYTYCVNNIIQAFNYKWSARTSWAILTTDNIKYITPVDDRSYTFKFDQSLIYDNITTIIFEPTGNTDLIKSIDIRGFNDKSPYYSFSSLSVMTKDEYTKILNGPNSAYYLSVSMSGEGSIKINVYFS